MTKLYQQIPSTINARQNCESSGNSDWYDKHGCLLDHMERNYLPSGSGIDSGCTLIKDRCDVIVIESSYHVMNDGGYYTHWIDFKVTVRPSLQFNFELTITGAFGKDQDIKDYLYDLFNEVMNQEVLKSDIESCFD